MDNLQYVIPGYREYKRVWSPEINKRLSNSRKTSSLKSRTSLVQNLSKQKAPFKKYLWRQRAPALEQEKLVSCHKGAFIREAP